VYVYYVNYLFFITFPVGFLFLFFLLTFPISYLPESLHFQAGCCRRRLNLVFSLLHLFQIAKQMAKERQDIMGSNCLKGVTGKVIVDEKGIKDSLKDTRKS